jgi:hypothetical protein
MKNRETRIQTSTLGPARWADLRIAEEASWATNSHVIAYEESVGSCRIERKHLADVTPGPDSFEGRIFDEHVDVRWLRQPGLEDGQPIFRVWVTKECADGGIEVEAIPRTYYLIGVHSVDGWSEARYPQARFDYPVDPPSVEKSRARIHVEEYAPAEPDWSRLPSEEQVEHGLNQPRVIAHRFVSIEAGRD